ncbi:hypothetical protein [Streptomyces niveus]|uniref:hypothetical protein n=1 Tax=Streptomyces niveus TaxID=193462 RepID=UPI0034490BC8
MATPDPMGCLWCGVPHREHMRRWKPPVGWHEWAAPTQERILARMEVRRADRLATNPAVYHATTAWAADLTGESADPYCADCKTDVCFRWSRVQARLDRQRWGMPRPKADEPGGWGGNEPWPF